MLIVPLDAWCYNSPKFIFSSLKGQKKMSFFSDLLQCLHFSRGKWLLGSCNICFYFGLCFWTGRQGYLSAFFSVLSPPPRFPILLSFGLFRVLNSSFLGKVLLIVIGQNLLWWGEGVQLFIFFWSCQFEKKWSPLVEPLFSFLFPTSQSLCFSLLVSLCLLSAFPSPSISPYLFQSNYVWANAVKLILSNSILCAPRCCMLGPVLYTVFSSETRRKQVNF